MSISPIPFGPGELDVGDQEQVALVADLGNDRGDNGDGLLEGIESLGSALNKLHGHDTAFNNLIELLEIAAEHLVVLNMPLLLALDLHVLTS